MALGDLSGATTQTLTFEVSEFLVIMPTHTLADVFFHLLIRLIMRTQRDIPVYYECQHILDVGESQHLHIWGQLSFGVN